MKKKTTLLKSLLIAVAMLAGVNGAWADATSLYERGTTNDWSDADLTDWTSSYCTPTISGGLSVNTKNAGWTNTKSISVTANSIVTLDATLKTGGASGRSGSYDYVKIGGVTIGFKEQDRVAFVDVDGVSTNLTLTYNRATAYSIQVVIDQATGAVSYTVGSASGTSTSSTAITGVEFGHSKAGKENYAITTVLQKVEVSEEPQTVTMAGYKVKYVCGITEIKDADDSRTGVVGTDVSLTPSDKASFFNSGSTIKYIYVSDNSEGNAIAGDGSTVVTVSFREAETWDYTLNAMNGETKIEEFDAGSYFEGEIVKVPFHKYYNIGGTLYKKDAINNEYRYSFTLSSNDQVENLAYTTSSFDNVVFFKEAEDIETLTETSTNGTSTRCSFAKGGYASDYAVITSLTPGKYILTGAGYGGNLVFKAGETEVLNMETAGYWRETASTEFTITENTDITFKGGAEGGNASLDYVIIQKTGDIETVKATITHECGYATFCSDKALDFSAVEGLTAYIVTSTEGVATLKKVTKVPAGTGLVLEGAVNTYDVPVIAFADPIEDNLLIAATTDHTAVEGDYVLAYQSEVRAFFPAEPDLTIAAGKAYLHIPAGSAPAFLPFATETTGISATLKNSEKVNKEVFNLNGQRVSQPTKGLYIVGGRKVVVK